MRFRITGIDRDTGLNTTLVLSASSKREALQEADSRDVLVEHMEEMRDATSDNPLSTPLGSPSGQSKTTVAAPSKRKHRLLSLRLIGLTLFLLGTIIIWLSSGTTDSIHSLLFVVAGSASASTGMLLIGLATVGERLLNNSWTISHP